MVTVVLALAQAQLLPLNWLHGHQFEEDEPGIYFGVPYPAIDLDPTLPPNITTTSIAIIITITTTITPIITNFSTTTTVTITNTTSPTTVSPIITTITPTTYISTTTTITTVTIPITTSDDVVITITITEYTHTSVPTIITGKTDNDTSFNFRGLNSMSSNANAAFTSLATTNTYLITNSNSNNDFDLGEEKPGSAPLLVPDLLHLQVLRSFTLNPNLGTNTKENYMFNSPPYASINDDHFDSNSVRNDLLSLDMSTQEYNFMSSFSPSYDFNEDFVNEKLQFISIAPTYSSSYVRDVKSDLVYPDISNSDLFPSSTVLTPLIFSHANPPLTSPLPPSVIYTPRPPLLSNFYPLPDVKDNEVFPDHAYDSENILITPSNVVTPSIFTYTKSLLPPPPPLPASSHLYPSLSSPSTLPSSPLAPFSPPS